MTKPNAARFVRPFASLCSVLALLLAVSLQPATADVTVELHPDNDVRIVNDGGLPGDDRLDDGQADAPLANRIAALSVRFPQGSPSIYFLGSDRDIDLIVDGALPGGATATVSAWHRGDQAFVDSFDVRLGEDAWSIPAESLEVIGQGRVELRVVLTAPGLRQVEIAQEYLFLPPGLDEDVVETWYDPPTPEEIEEELKTIPDFVPVPGQGFVDYDPTPGAQVYYVAEAGSDSNSGLSPQDPLRTLRSAYDRVGDKDGDTILLKAGDTFQGGIGFFNKGGKSIDKPLLISTYGEGDRPIIHTNGDGFLSAGGFVSNVIIDGLYILANKRTNFEDGISWKAPGKNITIQDCKIEGYKGPLVFQGPSKRAINNVTIRRCIIVDAYGHHQASKGGHSSGLYMDNVYQAVIEESIFDHNGWHPTVSGASRTKFNHNVYIQKTCEQVNFYRSVFSRGSHNGVQNRGGGIFQDNLFYQNALAAFVAQAPSLMEGNVVMNADDMDADDPAMFRGDGLEVLPCEHAIVRNNLVLNKIGQAGWAGGIEVEWRDDIVDPPSKFFVEIYDNIVVNYPMTHHHKGINVWTKSADVSMRNNIVDKISGGNDTPNFVDDSRSMDTYVSGGFNTFIREARNRPRGTWDPIFSAASFNKFMREGFTPR